MKYVYFYFTNAMSRIVALLNLLIIISPIFISENLSAQPGFNPEFRGAVYRIEQPGIKYGTATMFSHGEYNFLITNRHVISNSAGDICDSIFIYLNRIDKDKEVTSGPTYRTVYLTTPLDTYYILPSDSNVDIAMISFGLGNTNIDTTTDRFFRLRASVFLNPDSLITLMDSGMIVTAIGFPQKILISTEYPRYAEYRWGYLIGRDSLFIKLDVPVIHGSSGSPIFINAKGKYYFIGIATFLRNNLCFAVPAYLIKYYFKTCFDYMEKSGE